MIELSSIGIIASSIAISFATFLTVGGALESAVITCILLFSKHCNHNPILCTEMQIIVPDSCVALLQGFFMALAFADFVFGGTLSASLAKDIYFLLIQELNPFLT